MNHKPTRVGYKPATAWNRRKQLGRMLSPASLAIVLLFASPVVRAHQQAPIRITGSAADRSGAPVPGVLIEVRTRPEQVVASTMTNALGGFSLALAEGAYFLDATAPGLAPIRGYRLEVTAAANPVRLILEIASIEHQIVVTATRTEAPLAQVGSSITVIRGEELERNGIGSLADAARQVAGLTVVQNGSSGQLVSLFIRGGESDYAKVMIDGIPVNDPGGGFNFANLDISGIERIEIVRGPQSALFGSDAMAGVMQIFTRRGSSEGLEPKPHIAVTGGSFGTFRYEAGIEGSGEKVDYALSFARLDTDNNVRNGSFNNGTASANLGLRPSAKSQLRIVFHSSAGRAGVPGQWGFHRPDPDQFYRHRGLAGGATFTSFTYPSWTQTLSYTISDSRQYSENADAGSFSAGYQGRQAGPFYDFPFQTLNRSRRQKFAYQSEWAPTRAHLLTAGAEYERESGTVGDPRANPLMAVRNNFGGFVQEQWSLRKRFFAAAGVRLEHNESFGFSAAPRLSLAWHIHQAAQGRFLALTKLKANFGYGIKEPSLVESFSKSPFFLGNPDLKAEKSTSYDAGIEQHFGSGRGAAEVVFFENRFRNQIGFVTTDFTTFAGSFFNIGKTRARGVETSLRIRLAEALEAAGCYTFLDSLVLENAAAPDPVFAAGQPLFRRPRHSGFLDLKWKPGRWTLGAGAGMVGSRSDSDFLGLGLTRNPGYGVLNLLLSFRLFSGAHLFVIVNNALDRRYMESFGYPALPARFRIGLSAGQ